jgi:mannitol/fructose-specific phosphotransferase system IIA component (Ntr-type)
MDLGQFTETRLLVPRLLSDRQASALRELTKRLEVTGRIDSADAFYGAVLRREELVPTMVGNGLVFPHARGEAVRSFSVAIGLSSSGIPWGDKRQFLARAVILFAVPLSDSPLYLRALSAVSGFFMDPTAYSTFEECSQPEQMLEILRTIGLPAGASRERLGE